MKSRLLIVLTALAVATTLAACGPDSNKAAADAKKAATEAADKAKEAATKAAEATKDAAKEATDATKDAAGKAVDAAKEAAAPAAAPGAAPPRHLRQRLPRLSSNAADARNNAKRRRDAGVFVSGPCHRGRAFVRRGQACLPAA